MDVHIAEGTTRSGQFKIPRDKVKVSQAVFRDTGHALKGADIPAYTLHDGPSGVFMELAQPASGYLMFQVDDSSEPVAEPGSPKLRAWQKETAAASASAGASPAPGAPSPAEE